MLLQSIVLLFVTRPNTSESDETKENALEATSAETEARFSEMSIQSTDISESIPHTSDDRGSRMSSYANEDGMVIIMYCSHVYKSVFFPNPTRNHYSYSQIGRLPFFEIQMVAEE